ncbi:MBOAT family protein [Acetobacter musti]|uniref:Probable alginate O-acetylase AlgI n=1 Tax=Acetobacter musti TaxID=864732 RepID=A0ABX0JUQ8_9PROT|nr:MBOAT family protein [Acetobacter musti]NHN85269.1 MBOAT family protein [Acetobacter musti]
MLFNSRIFILYFLPAVYAGFVFLTRIRQERAAVGWLAGASLLFYSWWNIACLPIFLASIVMNFVFGTWLARSPSRSLFLFAVGLNLLALAWYKYAGFLFQTLDQIPGVSLSVPSIVLPLAISFFTFQQIAYLSDAHDGRAVEHSFPDYLLFISFFPHLIAGPITHHREMLPQFTQLLRSGGEVGRLTVGLTLFLTGLTKKVILADPIGTYVGPVFSLAREGGIPSFTLAWSGALSYAMQIYFDFSGYTDMAIGLGLLFGISLPPNFDSPYKARNIIEFWSRWHMTLTRFLTAYVYNPITLALTRARVKSGRPVPKRGKTTPGAFATLTAGPTVFTMFVSGVWHGAGWQFIVFGLLHGIYLTVTHAWHALKAHRPSLVRPETRVKTVFSVLLTFLCVLVGLIFFRVADVGSACRILLGMAGHSLRQPLSMPDIAGVTATQVLALVVLGLIVWFLPNASQWMRDYRTALEPEAGFPRTDGSFFALKWRPTFAFGLLTGLVGTLALMRALSAAPTEFLYFQF